MLIDWENELLLVTRKTNPGEFEIVMPSVSILAEPPVAVVEKNAKRKGTAEVAKAYLEYLYTEEGQEDRRKTLLPSNRSGGDGEVRRHLSETEVVHD